MPYTPPIRRRERRAILNDKRFYKLLAEKCVSFANHDQAFLVYSMIFAVIADELERFGAVRLPHLGDLAIVEQKPRLGWAGRVRVRFGPRKVLKLYLNDMLRRRFNKRQEF